MFSNRAFRKTVAACALLGIAGCTSAGPPEFNSCLEDKGTMASFNARRGMKELVGGIGPDGNVYCLQGQTKLVFGETGNPGSLCLRSQHAGGMKHCTLLATHTMVGFKPDASKPRPRPGYQVFRIDTDTLKNKTASYDMANVAEIAAGAALIVGVGTLAVMGAKAEARAERNANTPDPPFVPPPQAGAARATARPRIAAMSTAGSTFYSDGTSSRRVGNTTFYSDGTTAQHIGDNTFFSDGTSANTVGGTTYFSDGTTARRTGNATVFSDGTSCTRTGNRVNCR